MRSCYITQEAQPVLCDNPEGWLGTGSGKEVQEGRDQCIIMIDSHQCMGETNTS